MVYNIVIVGKYRFALRVCFNEQFPEISMMTPLSLNKSLVYRGVAVQIYKNIRNRLMIYISETYS